MNTKQIIHKAILVLMPLFTTMAASAALPTTGEWTGQTLSASQTVNLTGSVSISGTIVIPNGVTLTLNPTEPPAPYPQEDPWGTLTIICST